MQSESLVQVLALWAVIAAADPLHRPLWQVSPAMTLQSPLDVQYFGYVPGTLSEAPGTLSGAQ